MTLFDIDLTETVTVLDGIRAAAGPAVRVEYAPGTTTLKCPY